MGYEFWKAELTHINLVAKQGVQIRVHDPEVNKIILSVLFAGSPYRGGGRGLSGSIPPPHTTVWHCLFPCLQIKYTKEAPLVCSVPSL
jgi:hypothetical protein